MSLRIMKFSAFVCLISVVACSHSQPKTAPVEGAHQWDYKTIREKRAAEQEATPPPKSSTDLDDEASCSILTHDQVVRSKVSGCRKLDPRSGHGEDAYCCPRE